MIEITPSISIEENEISQEFIRGSGPGGQNVNKVATAVQLRFDVAHSPSLPDEVRQRLFFLARRRTNEQGMLIIEARQFRTQSANRKDAIDRLVRLIRKAAERPKIRRKTKITRAKKELRLESKRHHAETKRLRRPILKTVDD
jgi:ribosome-associated protein